MTPERQEGPILHVREPEDFGFAGSRMVRCDCAATPPTMPTCRSEHLPECALVVESRAAAYRVVSWLWWNELTEHERAAMAAGATTVDDILPRLLSRLGVSGEAR